jgi:hypothetical protein
MTALTARPAETTITIGRAELRLLSGIDRVDIRFTLLVSACT